MSSRHIRYQLDQPQQVLYPETRPRIRCDDEWIRRYDIRPRRRNPRPAAVDPIDQYALDAAHVAVIEDLDLSTRPRMKRVRDSDVIDCTGYMRRSSLWFQTAKKLS